MTRSLEGLQQNNGGTKENLKRSLYEVRFADLARDAGAVAGLYSQPSAIEHLAGVAPTETPPGVDVRKYGIKNPNFGIFIATGDEIKRIYDDKKQDQPFKLFVATDTRSKVVGTVAVVLPATGLNFAQVIRIVVADSARGQGVGRKLLQSADAYIFGKPKDGGLGALAAEAGIIKVTGQQIPMGLFGAEGYKFQREVSRNCKSWDMQTGLFVDRDVIIVRREVQDRESRDPKIDPANIPSQRAA